MTRTAVIAGVGPGLGASIARRFVDEGCRVGLFARSADYLDGLSSELGDSALAVPTDITDPAQVQAGFEEVREAFGPVDVLVNHASGGSWKGLRDISPAEFERAWRVSANGALLCSQEAVADMLGDDGEDAGEGGEGVSDDGEGGDGEGGDARDDDGAYDGTIIFTGATSALRGRDGAIGFSAAKFAVRGMAESMARELGPQGIHVAHVVIDGQILTPQVQDHYPDRDAREFLDPDAIAESYWHLVTQDRSSWTLELDLRPHVEEF